MSADLPDFTTYGYQLRTELGHNRLGGRTTYLATNSQNYPVVLKQFQFATSGSSWGEYDAYQQEITMLRRLQHPGIPRYLDAFQTPDGFCMVQQYISGESLATPRNWTPQEIKHIALATLEILTYLQSQHPPIIHRDIKPENLLVDEQMKVYLVDFGFARMGGGEIAASSVVKGTMGFMPPEQLFNRQLTTASDLYGLGATLICLLTGTKSGDIGNLIDADYQIHFQHLFPPLKRGWMSWLSKITAPKVADRYPSAAAALAALKPLDVDRLPKLIISHNSLQFTASKWQEKVSQTVTLSNPIPETLLAGQFSVAPHPSDPPHTPYDHAWISFDRATFEGNLVNCAITVDTSNLLADTSYTREVLLDSNADAEPEVITVTVQTAPLPKPENMSYLLLAVTMIIFGSIGMFLAKQPNILTIPGLIPLIVAIDLAIWKKSDGFSPNIQKLAKKFGIALIGQLGGIVMGAFLFRALDIGMALWGAIIAYILATINENKNIIIKTNKYDEFAPHFFGWVFWWFIWVLISDKFWPLTKINLWCLVVIQLFFIRNVECRYKTLHKKLHLCL
uniref:non-specific serine/threonine protein kinase n=1 Tax=Planktothricoides sp. SpSt-374 TaxID=2282167 RepID=A0A7C3VTE4_9CYAN